MYTRTGIFAGVITAAALLSTGALAQSIDSSFNELDQDDDGVLSQQEVQGTPLAQNYQDADVDQDSNISETEFDLYKEQLELQQSGSGQGGGGQSGSGSGQSGGGSGSGSLPDFGQLDQDGNGNISQQEAQGTQQLQQNFNQADSDGNGNISEQEYQQFMQQHGG